MITFAAAIALFSMSLFLLVKTFVIAVKLIFRTVQFVIDIRK